MNSVRVLVFPLLLFGVVSSALADNPVCRASNDADGIKLHVPPLFEKNKGWQDREDATQRYKSGPWLALACKARQCRLVRVEMKARTLHPKDDYYGCRTYQQLSWDLSVLGKGEDALMLLQPTPALREGEVTTWYVGEAYKPNRNFVPFSMRGTRVDVSIRVPTPTAENRGRVAVLSTLWVTSSRCTQAQEREEQCMRKTVRIQLREGEVRQWVTAPWKGSPDTANCMQLITVEGDFNRDYLAWVGDLDGDQKPDYLLANDDKDKNGYALYLSSKAGPQQLAAKADEHWTDMTCD